MNKKVLKRKINFIKKPITDYLFKEKHRNVNQYTKFYETLPVKKNTILYESRDGNSITDSPYAMFKYMLKSPEFKNFLHIWSVQDFDALSSVISKYKDIPNVKFVKRNSKSYLKCLASCEYLINNATFQSYFTPKNNQVYINTWHGTPLKNMGFDIPGNPSNSQNVVRNFLSTNYILSPNTHTTNIFMESYKLSGLYEGEIIEEGYPRIDLTLNTNPEHLTGELRSLGLIVDDGKENILYAPTWKGTNITEVNNDINQIIADIKHLENELDDKYNILIKVHPFLYKEAVTHGDIKHRLVPDFVDTNELLSTIDVLVTDYSSIFFDFLVTNKPIIFYTWDNDVYGEERGQYLRNEDLPGPMVFNCKELLYAINNIENVISDFSNKYKDMQQKFTDCENGRVTERIVSNIFNNTTEKLNTVSNSHSKKEKILIYSGGMMDNGITTSFINLMSNIDYDRYDVSCFTATPHHKEVLKNLDKVDENVRFLFKPGLPNYKLSEIYRDKFIHNRGVQGALGERIFPEEAYIREHARLFGNTQFDYVIDFSGYSLFWAKYLIVADAKRKICFMHNDLLSDSERTIKGRKPHRINLRGLFSIYNRFDKLVSVSKGTMELNRENLSEYADYNKFDYVMNSINPNKILEMASQNSDKDKEEDSNDTSLKTENYKARAIVTDYQNSVVWNVLTNDTNSTKVLLEDKLDNTEIEISRKADFEQTTYYKFSHNNQIIGWINADAITLLPDSIIYEEDKNVIAKVSRPRGNHIFSKPFEMEGCEKVSTSWDYQNMIVEIDKEAQTQHSTYSRMLINETIIGWIDNRALNFYNQCAISDTTKVLDKLTIGLKRKYIKSRNNKSKKTFINNIENRTLKEINIEDKMFATITKPENNSIWTKALPSNNVKKVAVAKEYEGQMVEINTIKETRTGTYYLFYIGDEKIGWMDAKGFEVINKPTIIEKKKVSRVGKIKLRKTDYIWNKPYGQQDAVVMMNNPKSLNGHMVDIDEEVTTQEGIYSHMKEDDISLGWLDNRSLVITKVFGFEVGDRFIPGPSEENINFVNMGRLSPEKGQDNLIHAFASFHKEHRNSKLYILGRGPLEADLQSIIDELELNDSVYLLGQIENPFFLMSKCNCFVLSSHYEGQPMVLLEAMTLGMKIIATDIVANRTVLEEGKYGVLVENSISGLKKGLSTVADEGNTSRKNIFDSKKYNDQAMSTFYKTFQ